MTEKRKEKREKETDLLWILRSRSEEEGIGGSRIVRGGLSENEGIFEGVRGKSVCGNRANATAERATKTEGGRKYGKKRIDVDGQLCDS